MIRGSLRSDSAIRNSGRPVSAASSSTASDSSSRKWRARVSTSACTASRRSPSIRWSRSHASALCTRYARTSSEPGASRLTAAPHGVWCVSVKYGPNRGR
ncbi:hypothetical protein STENM223S_00536 [Streptomyces tendae]